MCSLGSAATGAAAARREVLELGGLVQDTAPALPALEDRMTAVAEAAQVGRGFRAWLGSNRLCSAM